MFTVCIVLLAIAFFILWWSLPRVHMWIGHKVQEHNDKFYTENNNKVEREEDVNE